MAQEPETEKNASGIAHAAKAKVGLRCGTGGCFP